MSSPSPDRRPAERLVGGLLCVSALASVAFVAVFVTSADTQLLGIALALGLGAAAAALILAAARIATAETRTEERPAAFLPGAHAGSEPGEAEREATRRGPAAGPEPPFAARERDVAEASDEFLRGARPLTRRRLLLASGAAAGGALAAAAAVPIAALGPSTTRTLYGTPWRSGRRLVDEEGAAITAADVATGSFLTAFPEGADPDDFGSPVVVVRVDPDELDLPPERTGWAPGGLLAYSKICTHAACAINLYRAPNYAPESAQPALVCPCHYSTFDVRRGGEVIFGPAGRDLPQLPLRVDAGGSLVAAGPMSGLVGPSWRGVRDEPGESV